MRRGRLLSVAVCGLVLLGRAGAEAPAGISVAPRGLIPLGASAGLFRFGGGAEVTGSTVLARLPLYLRAAAGYTVVPAQADASYLSLLTLGVGGGLSLDLGNVVNLRLGGTGGGYLGLYKGSAGGNPYASGEASVSFAFTPALSLGLGGGYEWYAARSATAVTSLLSGLSASVAVSLRPGAATAAAARPRLEIREPQFRRVFPVFYSYYNDNPLGSVTVRNGERGPIENLSVRFLVPQFMEAPKQSPVVAGLGPGKSVEVPLYALFRDSLLGITESAAVTAEVQATYTYNGRELTVSAPFTLRIQNRNEMTWDDDRKAAAFVTPRDPAVQKFARNVAAAVRGSGATAVNEKLRTAMAIFTALGLYGMEYAIDPASSYLELSESADAVDYLLFPNQTLDYRAGDCDDLSILYAALLESVATRAAFVTTPGHIYVAFALDMDREEAEKTFASMGDLVFHGDEAWLPVEITLIKEGFLKAWSAGAKEWREASVAGTAALYPLEEAWAVYAPTGFASSAAAPEVPSSAEVLPRYLLALKTFVEREIAPQVEDLRSRIAASGEDPRLTNRLGTLYARYGMYEEAEAQFLRAIRRDPKFLPAMVNLGNIYFLKPDLEKALDYYTRAFGSRPDDPTVLISLARTHFEREEYSPATRRYREAEAIDPKTTREYAYIVSENGDQARASAAQERGRVLWDE
jgi:tetratricopeptide (TPR) repeat protein